MCLETDACCHVVVCDLVSHPPPHVHKLELHRIFVPERGYSGHVVMWSSVVSSLTPHLMSTNWNSTAYLSLKEDTKVVTCLCGHLWSRSSPPTSCPQTGTPRHIYP
jgi:hypothetical protein